MAYISAGTSQSLADENAFHCFKAQIVEALGGRADLGQPEIGVLYTRTTSHEDSTLNRMIEFPDVARPAVLEHRLQRSGCEAGRSLAVAGGIAGEEVSGENRNIFAAITQRGKMNLYSVEAEEQILAKAARGTLLLQVGIGRREQTSVHPPGLRGADTLEVAGLEYTQQLGLLAHGNIGDFIEEEGTAVGEFEAPNAVGARVGESSFDMAEELAFKRSFRQGASVYGDQGTRGARGERMQRLSDNFLAGSVLAGDEHVGIRRSNAR